MCWCTPNIRTPVCGKPECRASQVVHSGEPVFGERLRGIYAGEKNPHRDGFYVRTIHRTGRLNPGKWYELTDKKGDFWQYESKSVIFLDRNTDHVREV